MRPPIIVDAKGELLFFRTVGAAQGYIEEVDVRNGEYGCAYDAEGRLLRIGVEKREAPIVAPLKLTGESIAIEAVEEAPTHDLELRALLAAFLRKLGDKEPALDEMSLPRLVQRGLDKAGFR